MKKVNEWKRNWFNLQYKKVIAERMRMKKRRGKIENEISNWIAFFCSNSSKILAVGVNYYVYVSK